MRPVTFNNYFIKLRTIRLSIHYHRVAPKLNVTNLLMNPTHKHPYKTSTVKDKVQQLSVDSN